MGVVTSSTGEGGGVPRPQEVLQMQEDRDVITSCWVPKLSNSRAYNN